MADPSRYELAKVSYGEVLDATKHQDDKIGRLLGAVAFLTGGALVFADRDFLDAGYDLGGREYPLIALCLGAFLVLDLAAVIIWFLTVSAPLGMPEQSAAEAAKGTHLYFQGIAKRPLADWRTAWDQDSASIAETITANLVTEAHNLAVRADRKYERSRLASRIFLSSVVLLVPTLVLSVDVARRPRPAIGQALLAPETVAWTGGLRVMLACAMAVVLLVLGFWRWDVARESASAGGGVLQPASVLLALSQVVFVVVCVAADGHRWYWLPGALLSGLIATVLFAASDSQDRPGRLPNVVVAAALTVAAGAAIGFDRPDVQLLVGLLASCLVLFQLPRESVAPAPIP